jgi:hypothetical protein
MTGLFFLLVCLCTLSIAVVTVIGHRKGVPFQVMFQKIIIWTIGSSLVVGVLVGTWVSHGFDVPWWLFGVINVLLMLMSFLVTFGILRLFSKKVDEK